MTSDLNTPRIDSYRFSMANLEETLDADLDAILGELCALENKCDEEIAGARNSKRESRSEQPRSRLDADEHNGGKIEQMGRTESPDNDSAFSDNVSLLSSESSASSGGSSGASKTSSGLGIDPHPQNETAHRIKAEKIRIALEKMKQAEVKKLFIKAFTSDGSTKSLLVDEKMTCSFVARLLADKNHVTMDPKWGLVEHLPDLYMERVYEEHELLVENLMLWTRDSPNTILFHERPDKYQMLKTPEHFLQDDDVIQSEYDAQSRGMLIEDFFSHARVPEISGPLYLKTDSRKCWKRYQFVLRASGLYYYPKEKSKSLKDLSCLASFDMNQVYYGVGWRKKYKSPTDFCFAIKHPRLQQPKSTKYIKYLCAEDNATLQRWVVGIRIAKYGRQLLDNYRTLLDDMAQEDLDQLAHARSCSTASIAQADQSRPSSYITHDEVDRRSMVSCSSSSSSGCHSDGVSGSETGFLSDYPSGTIKRKPPTIQPKIPLTSMTRQLIEAGEGVESGTLTRRASWRRSQTVDESGQSTLTRGRSLRAQLSVEEPGSQSTLTRGRSLRSPLTNEGRGSEEGSQSTLTRRRTVEPAADDGLVTSRRRTTDPASVLNEASRTLNEAVNNLLAETQSDGFNNEPITLLSPDSHFEDTMERDLEAISDHSSSFGEEEKDEEDDLPPPPAMFDSTLSLDSLPPPPSQSELPVFDSEMSCSSLSLASLPPYPEPTSPKSDLSTPVSSGDVTPTNGTPTRNKAARAFDFRSGVATPPNNNSLVRNQTTGADSPNSGEVTPTNGTLTRKMTQESGRITPNRTPVLNQSAHSQSIYHPSALSQSPNNQSVHSPHSQSAHSHAIYSQSPHSQPIFNQSPHSQPIYNQSPHSQPIYNQSPHSQPIYNQLPHSQPIYNQSTHLQHSQSPHSQPIYNQSGHSQPIYNQSVHPQQNPSAHSQAIYSQSPHSQPIFSQSGSPKLHQSGQSTPQNSPLSRASLRSIESKSPDSPKVMIQQGLKAPYYPPLPNTSQTSPLANQLKGRPMPSSPVRLNSTNSTVPVKSALVQSANGVAALPASPRLPPVGPRRVTFAPTPAPPPPAKLLPPANDFLKDLQRVMRKKWQVSQKCAAEPSVSPHEVLGFRDPPQSKEAHVSDWVNQHYGLYENVYHPDTVAPPPAPATKKRPPPPPPKRSETTHLTTRMY